MGTTIQGALISIQVDLGDAPFILDRDYLDLELSILTPIDEALSDITCEVLSAKWQWGAPNANGILTDVTTGQAEVALADPNRELDPLNAESPVIGRIGNPARILIDGTPAFSGVVTNIAHDAGQMVSTLNLADPLSLLHQQSVSIAWAVPRPRRSSMPCSTKSNGPPTNAFCTGRPSPPASPMNSLGPHSRP